MKRCPQCGKQYSTEANFCPIDAGRLEEVPDDAAAERDDQILGGRFVIGEHLGDGGKTGQVFEATDNQTGEPCVIKWVDRDVFSSALQMQRTERELKQLERATAPGIGRILGHGRKGERLWFATELFPSRSLEEIVESEGPLSAERAASLVHTIGTALAEAAKLGVIHRDVAPKNILVSEDDEVKVINFGVAVPTTPSVRGVPEFVAPEQVDGKPVDQRSNIYSLGAIYFYLVTGRPPFEGDVQAVHSAHLHSPPPRASEHADVSADVDKLIDRALAKQSSKRYMTLRQLLGELEKLAGVEPSTSTRMAAARREANAAAQTMLGVGALSAEGYSVSQQSPAAALADLAPPVSGRSPRDSFEDVDDEAKTNKLAVVSSQDGASTSGEIGTGQPVASQPSPRNGEPVDDDRPQPVAGEIGGEPAELSTGNGESAEPVGDGEDEDDFDSRVTQPSQGPTATNKRKKRRRRRKKRRTRRPPADEKFRDTMWFKKGEVGDGDGDTDVAETEQRYADDGSLTEDDEQRLSLRAAETSGVASAIDRREGAADKELPDEMSSNRTLLIAGGVLAVIVVIVLIAVMAMS